MDNETITKELCEKHITPQTCLLDGFIKDSFVDKEKCKHLNTECVFDQNYYDKYINKYSDILMN